MRVASSNKVSPDLRVLKPQPNVTYCNKVLYRKDGFITKQWYNELTHDLCVQAVLFCFDRKWHRPSVQAFINHYAGISEREFYKAELDGSVLVQLEAADAIAYYLEELVEEIMQGEPLDMQEVIVRPRIDGMSGKKRDICDLCVLHQLLGHLVKLGLDPLFHARILPTQFASLPGKGQTGLKNQIERYLHRKGLKIVYAQKTDIYNAYGSLKYDVVINLIVNDIPSAKWIIMLLDALAGYAPGRHLIIGGYIDAWLFNYVMSFALRYVCSRGKTRREEFIQYIICSVSYMDDFGLFGSSKYDLRKSVKILKNFLQAKFNVCLKIKESMISFLSYEKERERKHTKNRGCPCIDMGGYKIHRGYTTIRPRIFIRLRRAYLRAWEEVLKNGTFHLPCASKLIAYYGYVEQTDSELVRKNYHVDYLHRMARKIKSFWSKRANLERRERILRYALL